jgi:hypothetical protein
MTRFNFVGKLIKPIVLIFTLFFSEVVYPQDISGGSWRWDDEGRSFAIYLDKANPTLQAGFDIVGNHCGVFENGNRMDCEVEDLTIFLKKQSNNVYLGKIQSAYAMTDFEIRLTYLKEEEKVHWEVTKKGEGIFYFPLNVIMNR